MKFLLGVLFYLAAITLPKTAFSVPSDSRLGLVDYQRALNSVDEGKAAKTQIEKEEKALEDREEKLKKTLMDLQEQKGKEMSGLLKPADVTKLRKLEEDTQKQIIEHQQSGEKLGQKQKAKTNEILLKVQKIAEEVSRAGAYTLVLEKSMGALVYAASATDFTEEVIQRYNKQFKATAEKK